MMVDEPQTYKEPFSTPKIKGIMGELKPEDTMFVEASEEFVKAVPEPFV